MTRVLAVGLLVCCGGSSAPPPAPAVASNGAVAATGSVRIEADLVSRVASARQETARAALDELIFDAVLSEGARAQKLDARPDVREALRTTRARIVADRIAAFVASKGPPTDAEVDEVTKRHWREVDLPERARAVHVVVMTNKDPAKAARMRAVAEALRQAVLGAKDEEDFLARAKRVDSQGLEVRPESLPTFTEDGRVVEADQPFDTAFTKAAFALAPGETSGIIETPFGLHVIRMLERLPPEQVPFEERRKRFEPEVRAQRGHAELTTLLAELKRTHPVVVDQAADVLMASAPVSHAAEVR